MSPARIDDACLTISCIRVLSAGSSSCARTLLTPLRRRGLLMKLSPSAKVHELYCLTAMVPKSSLKLEVGSWKSMPMSACLAASAFRDRANTEFTPATGRP